MVVHKSTRYDDYGKISWFFVLKLNGKISWFYKRVGILKLSYVLILTNVDANVDSKLMIVFFF